ncbi:MAG TPA: 50S ribosomal protein L6 [Dehalococcoidia bacterium]|nr:50S ribosomal protein L6 [Dehalococcoidia bacterium]
MSRIGKQPIELPKGVEVTLEGSHVRMKGPKGQLERDLSKEMDIKLQDGTLSVNRPSDKPEHRAMHGLTRALLANMAIGVSEGFSKTLEIQGVGYRAAKQGNNLSLQVGFSRPIDVVPPKGIEFEVENPTTVHIHGIDKELVGQVAADVRKVRPPEPYKGKGIRYRGEYVRRKAGKGAR